MSNILNSFNPLFMDEQNFLPEHSSSTVDRGMCVCVWSDRGSHRYFPQIQFSQDGEFAGWISKMVFGHHTNRRPSLNLILVETQERNKFGKISILTGLDAVLCTPWNQISHKIPTRSALLNRNFIGNANRTSSPSLLKSSLFLSLDVTGNADTNK